MERHEHRIPARTAAVYGLASILVLSIGVLAIWSFVERQRLRRNLAPDPLPAVTVLTADPQSELAASWVDLLGQAQFAPTLVAAERISPSPGSVLFLADLPTLTPALADQIRQILGAGGGVVVAGLPPVDAAELLGLTAARGESEDSMRIAEAASPVLARVRPGHVVGTAEGEVALLEESSEMRIDARWEKSSRAAIAHFRTGGGRVLWLGFPPAGIQDPDEQIELLLRTAFRWVASQPVSEAAVGLPAAAKTLTPAARNEARQKGLTFSVDRLEEPGSFSLRVRNRSDEVVTNPTVKVWMPEQISALETAGTWFSRRSLTVQRLDDEHAIIVSFPGLRGGEDRLIRLQAVDRATTE